MKAAYRDGKIPLPSGRWPANVLLSHAEECEQVGTRPDKHVKNVKPVAESEEHSEGWRTKPMETVEVETLREVWRCSPDCPVRLLDEQSGETKDNRGAYTQPPSAGYQHGRTVGDHLSAPGKKPFHIGDSGGASRFFYCAKASRRERGEGNDHPTVKPQALMRYLARLVTPPGGAVLAPFAGSGSGLLAFAAEGFGAVGIEREAHYVEVIRKRLTAAGVAHAVEVAAP